MRQSGMRARRVPVILVLVASSLGCAAAPRTRARPAPEWAPLSFLFGTWEATGQGGSTGGFTLEAELGGKVLVRHAFNQSPQGRHEDLTVFHKDPAGGIRATYFDNEGHVILYTVTVADNTAVFLSDEIAGGPRFRLTCALGQAGALTITFEIQPPGASAFAVYVKGEAHRVAAPN